MARIMIETGTFLSKQIDNLVRQKLSQPPKISLQDIVSKGKCHVGRLLHYFPFNIKEDVEDDWCGWHNDHSSLTALTSSMYIDKDGK